MNSPPSHGNVEVKFNVTTPLQTPRLSPSSPLLLCSLLILNRSSSTPTKHPPTSDTYYLTNIQPQQGPFNNGIQSLDRSRKGTHLPSMHTLFPASHSQLYRLSRSKSNYITNPCSSIARPPLPNHRRGRPGPLGQTQAPREPHPQSLRNHDLEREAESQESTRGGGR